MQHLACPDSGSEQNIMSESFALSEGFIISREPKDIKEFELGSGKRVRSIGRVCVPVEVMGEPVGRKKRWFYVLSNCPVPIIVGRPFISEAEILTKNRHILETCPAEIGAIPSLLWIGSPRCRMKCSLDGRDILVVADTGSDLNLMSLKCAKRRRFRIDRRPEAKRCVRVGDGSEVDTIGQVYVHSLSVDWREAETSTNTPPPTERCEGSDDDLDDSEESLTIFHVLPGLPCDVIFGRDLLDTLDAFNTFPDLLSPPPPPLPGPSDPPHNDSRPFELKILINLSPISKFLNQRRQAAVPISPLEDPRDRHERERRAEMWRRSKVTDLILTLPLDRQGAAKVTEEREQAGYERKHHACMYCHPP